MEERLNTPHTDKIEVDFLGHRLHLAQDPNSKHLGTTVWDSSLVFLKFLEQNCKKGELSHSKLAGKRVLELGAGCGLAGLGMALLGCHLVATDQVEVLPLLIRNLDRNMARAKHSPSESPFLGSLGTVEVEELNWGDEQQIKALKPPFDFIIGSDIVYKEQLVEPLVTTLIGLAGPKTTILLANEYRSSTVHEKMIHTWKESFDLKTIPRSKMDPTYQHEYIQLFRLKLKSPPSSFSTVQTHMGIESTVQERKETTPEALHENVVVHERNPSESRESLTPKSSACVCKAMGGTEANDSIGHACHDLIDADVIDSNEQNLHSGELTNWEIRRLGSVAARLMQNVYHT